MLSMPRKADNDVSHWAQARANSSTESSTLISVKFVVEGKYCQYDWK